MGQHDLTREGQPNGDQIGADQPRSIAAAGGRAQGRLGHELGTATGLSITSAESGQVVLFKPPSPATHGSSLAFFRPDPMNERGFSQGSLQNVSAHVATLGFHGLDDFRGGGRTVLSKPTDDPFRLFTVGFPLLAPAGRATHAVCPFQRAKKICQTSSSNLRSRARCMAASSVNQKVGVGPMSLSHCWTARANISPSAYCLHQLRNQSACACMASSPSD